MYFVRSFSFVGVAILSACGGNIQDSANGGPGAFSTGLPKDQSLAKLSAADAQKVCDALARYASSAEANKTNCRLAGVIDAGSFQFGETRTDADVQKVCTDSENACQQRHEATPDAGTAIPTCTKPNASCTATAGELETCLTDMNAVFERRTVGLPECSTLTVRFFHPQDAGVSIVNLNPPSCQTLVLECSGILQGVPTLFSN